MSHKRELESKVAVCLQVVSTTADNGANFVKAFRVYGPAENEAVTIDLRNTRQEDDEADFDEPVAIQYQTIAENIDECQLPNHNRCASHTLNLVATCDIEKVPRWSTGYQPGFRKVNCLTQLHCSFSFNENIGYNFLNKTISTPCTDDVKGSSPVEQTKS